MGKKDGMVADVGAEMNPNRNISSPMWNGRYEGKPERRREQGNLRYFRTPPVVWAWWPSSLPSSLYFPSPSLLSDAHQFVIKPASFNYNTLEVEHFSAPLSPPLFSVRVLQVHRDTSNRLITELGRGSAVTDELSHSHTRTPQHRALTLLSVGCDLIWSGVDILQGI